MWLDEAPQERLSKESLIILIVATFQVEII
jgi:hypothetical protein